jgi:hypothetical protein
MQGGACSNLVAYYVKIVTGYVADGLGEAIW